MGASGLEAMVDLGLSCLTAAANTECNVYFSVDVVTFPSELEGETPTRRHKEAYIM